MRFLGLLAILMSAVISASILYVMVMFPAYFLMAACVVALIAWSSAKVTA